MEKINILVLGDMILDEYLIGDSNRLSPEAPVPILNKHKIEHRLGGAANVVLNLKSFGVNPIPMGLVGGDAGYIIGFKFSNEGIETKYLIEESNYNTPRKTRILAGTQQLLRIDEEDELTLISEENEETMFEDIDYLLDEQNIKAVVISDYCKGGTTTAVIEYLINIANSKKIPIIADTKSANWDKFYGTTVMTPNTSEFKKLFETLKINQFEILKKFKIKHIVQTQAERGMTIYSSDQGTEHIPSDALEVFDVTGAGDTVAAAIAFKLAKGESISEACQFASKAAAVVVSKVGTATCTLDEINSEYPKVKSIEALSAVVSVEKTKGKTVVFTNGCFDLLHSGHVKLLQKAKQYGDILVVGINSDNSVKMLKGPERPIISENERAHLLSALSCVDYVIIFEELTPYIVIKKLEPDILIKGADYSGKDVVGSDLVEKVVLIELEPDKSTTNIVKKINNCEPKQGE